MEDGQEKTEVERSTHARREHERRERELAAQKKDEAAEQRQATKNLLWVGVSLVVIIAFAGGIMYLFNHQPTTYTQGEVHWHALIDLEICGQHVDLPRADSSSSAVMGGEPFRGIPLLHTHDDDILHIEGTVIKKEDIALGRFMDAIGVPFSNTTLMDKKNGDLCDGKPSTLKMFVNNVPRTDFRDYIPIATPDARKQVVKLVFGPDDGIDSAGNGSLEQLSSGTNVSPAESTMNMSDAGETPTPALNSSDMASSLNMTTLVKPNSS